MMVTGRAAPLVVALWVLGGLCSASGKLQSQFVVSQPCFVMCSLLDKHELGKINLPKLERESCVCSREFSSTGQ